MTQWTRRAVLRSGILASAAGAMGRASGAESPLEMIAPEPAAMGEGTELGTPGRERTLLDKGWKFSLGNADVVTKDFGFGEMARERPFSKQGQFSKVTSMDFDDAAWKTLDLPHDWAVELPFNSTKPLPEQGGRPLGREWPETSTGWYRKTFTLPAEDAKSASGWSLMA